MISKKQVHYTNSFTKIYDIRSFFDNSRFANMLFIAEQASLKDVFTTPICLKKCCFFINSTAYYANYYAIFIIKYNNL